MSQASLRLPKELRIASVSLGQSAAWAALAGRAWAYIRHPMPPRRQQRLGTRVVVVEHGVRAGQRPRHPVGEEGVHVRLPASASARWEASSGSGSSGVGRGGASGRGRVLPCSPAGAQVARASFVRPGAPRVRSERPSSIARGAPPRGAVAESSRRLRPTRRQPTRLPTGARQRCGWRRFRAPGASHDCCGCAAAAVAPPRRCGCAGCSAAPAPLDEQGEQQFARVSPRRADQTVVWACSGAAGGDYCSFARGQPR